MEDDKLAAYYDDLTRRGSGAARFKQGLGFSSSPSPADSAPPKGSSFLSSFVRASSPSKTTEYEKQAQLQSIQNKLSSKKSREEKPRNRSRSRSPSRRSKDHRRSRSRDTHSRRRSRSRSRGSRHRRRSRSSSHERHSKRIRSRSRSREKRDSRRNGGSAKADDEKLIEGYENMTPSERVKAKMNLQLSRTARNDETMGKGSGWERFNFDKDAPVDDEEYEAADDDASVVKQVGQSFRFTAAEANREEKLKSLHDDAIFGGSSFPLNPVADKKPKEEEGEEKRSLQQEETKTSQAACLLSDQVRTKQQGSWRDRVRKP